MKNAERPSSADSLRAVLLILAGTGTVLASAHASAQTQPAPGPAVPPAAPTPPGSTPATPDEPPATPAPASEAAEPSLADRMAKTEQQLAAQSEQIAELKRLLAERQSAPPVVEPEEPVLKIYGFMEAGFRKAWGDKNSPAAIYSNAIPKDFMVGGLNTYFDVNPSPEWRGLMEVRFTTAPNGKIENFGGLAGQFRRTSTQQLDPNGGAGNAPMWGSYVALERAHIDWTRFQLFKVRAGMFFTPFGIWNVDHGSPTLIPIALPQLIVSNLLPIRQTGLQFFGNTVSGDWELGYMATVTNGRQDQSAVSFTDHVGLGGRLYAADESSGSFSKRFGVSFYTGRDEDLQVDVTGATPVVSLAQKSTWAYREYMGGLDASLDIDRTRIRAEAAIRKIEYDPGKRADAIPLFTPVGAKAADTIIQTGYVIVAHQLPWAGLEPWVMAETLTGPLALADTALIFSGGINAHITDSVLFKSEFKEARFYNFRNDPDIDEAAMRRNNLRGVQARLVIAY